MALLCSELTRWPWAAIPPPFPLCNPKMLAYEVVVRIPQRIHAREVVQVRTELSFSWQRDACGTRANNWTSVLMECHKRMEQNTLVCFKAVYKCELLLLKKQITFRLRNQFNLLE